MINELRYITKTLCSSPSPRIDAEILLSHVLKVKRKELFSMNIQLTSKETALLNSLIEKRTSGQPIDYIIGKTEFYGLTFHVKKSVFIPRPETEKIVEQALYWLKPRDCVLDIGAGTGCIGLTIALLRPDVNVYAIEKSPYALNVIKQNKKHHNSPSNYNFKICDIINYTNTCNDKYQMVLSNPPYIGYFDNYIDPLVKKHEPKTALFAGPTGFECLESWSRSAYQILENNGIICFEIGFQQASKAKKIFKKNGFMDIKIIKDYSGLNRMIWAKK